MVEPDRLASAHFLMNLKAALNSLIEFGSDHTPSWWPHQGTHCIIATIIALALWPAVGFPCGAGIAAGVYIGREVQQWLGEDQAGAMTILDAGAPTLWLAVLILVFRLA